MNDIFHQHLNRYCFKDKYSGTKQPNFWFHKLNRDKKHTIEQYKVQNYNAIRNKKPNTKQVLRIWYKCMSKEVNEDNVHNALLLFDSILFYNNGFSHELCEKFYRYIHDYLRRFTSRSCTDECRDIFFAMTIFTKVICIQYSRLSNQIIHFWIMMMRTTGCLHPPKLLFYFIDKSLIIKPWFKICASLFTTYCKRSTTDHNIKYLEYASNLFWHIREKNLYTWNTYIYNVYIQTLLKFGKSNSLWHIAHIMINDGEKYDETTYKYLIQDCINNKQTHKGIVILKSLDVYISRNKLANPRFFSNARRIIYDMDRRQMCDFRKSQWSTYMSFPKIYHVLHLRDTNPFKLQSIWKYKTPK